MKKTIKSLNEINRKKLVAGTVYELESPVKKKGCPTTKNYKDLRNFVEIEIRKVRVLNIDGQERLVAKKVRQDGFEQKKPNFILN